MVSEKMAKLLNNNSAIRAMFEEGKRLREKFGDDKVYDFSLGNPNVPAPKEIKDIITDILNTQDSLAVHGYMSNAGYEDVRESIALSLNKRFKTSYTHKNLIMTAGAATAINISLKVLLNAGDEVIIFAPYFVEYANYISNYDGRAVVVEAKAPGFLPDMDELKNAVTKKTKAIIINSPNNPTGVVYPKSLLENINSVLRQKEKELGTVIFTISDEPYRELVYEGEEPAWVPDCIENTLTVYSYSKSLSLPGERIGWLLIPSDCAGFEEVVAALSIANRCSGSVNAPSLMQKVIARSLDLRSDISYYDRNRKLLYEKLRSLGFELTKPEGGFYIFMKSPIDDDVRFCEICKEFNVLLVPGSSFGVKSYVRIAYCVSYEMIERSFEAFEKIAGYFLTIY